MIIDVFEKKISYVCKNCHTILDTEEECKEHIEKCDVNIYREKYQGKYFITDDTLLTSYMYVRRVYSDTSSTILIECDITMLDYDCGLVYDSEEYAYTTDKFEDYIKGLKPISEKEFDCRFKEKMSEIADHLLEDMKKEE